MLIAEGSDWCWWYGPEHESANRIEFDQLYRSHLANVYRFLGLSPPEELSRPILRIAVPAVQIESTGPITPVIDGEVTSYFEWIGAGMYQVDTRSGSMHGKRFLIQQVLFGSDGKYLYLRVDFAPGAERELNGAEVRLTLESGDGRGRSRAVFGLSHGSAEVKDLQLASAEAQEAQCALGHVFEAKFPLAGLGVPFGCGVRFQLSLWQKGLPVDAVPQQGWLQLHTTDPAELSA